MNKSRLLVEELDGFELPSGVYLETILNYIQFSLVLFLELGDTQSILLCNLGLEDDLHIL